MPAFELARRCHGVAVEGAEDHAEGVDRRQERAEVAGRVQRPVPAAELARVEQDLVLGEEARERWYPRQGEAAIGPATSSVSAPIPAPTSCAAGASSNSGCMRAIRYTPAVTIVAAWISELTGVGASIASGSHVCSGICADLANAPTSSRRQPVTRSPLFVACPNAGCVVDSTA